jgi:hypothetical protein
VACSSHSDDPPVTGNDANLIVPGTNLAIPVDDALVDRSQLPPPEATQTALRYYVIPHADDEVESWSLLERDTDHYPVLMLMTHGEQSQFCNGSGFDANTNERLPQPQPFSNAPSAGRWTQTCGDERIDAWHFFLDEIAKEGRSHLGTVSYVGHFTGEIQTGDTSPTRCDSMTPTENCHPSQEFDVWVGPRSARVVFDLGDGDVRPEEVIWAVRTVQRHLNLFPIQTEDDVVAAGYANKVIFWGLPYTHPDHEAIHEAIFKTDLGTPGPQWGRTSAGDPDSVLSLAISGFAYNAMFEVDGDRRVGAHTVAYGWLATPYYEGCELGFACPFSHKQNFWKRF